MRHTTRLLALALCAAVMLSLPALAAADTPLISPAPDSIPAINSLAPVQVRGAVKKLENGSLLITSSDPDANFQEVVVHLPEGTPCVEAATGLPLDMAEVRDGDILYAWVGPAMTMSLPPQTSAVAVVGKIPADKAVPQYYQVAGPDQSAPTAERTEVKLPVAGGEVLTVPVSAQFTPWLTKQMVRVDDLVPGSQILVWQNQSGAVEKVLLLPYAYRGYYSLNGRGEVFVNGEKLSVGAKLSGPGLLPLRAVAEAVNYDVAWVNGQGAVVKEGDKVIFSVLPGAETARRPQSEDGDRELLAPCLVENGVTYLSAQDLTLLLDLYKA